MRFILFGIMAALLVPEHALSNQFMSINQAVDIQSHHEIRTSGNISITPYIPKKDQRSQIKELIIFSNCKSLVLNDEELATRLAKGRMSQNEQLIFRPGEIVQIVAFVENSSDRDYNKILDLNFKDKYNTNIDNAWLTERKWEIIGSKGAKSLIVTNGAIPNYAPGEYFFEFLLKDETKSEVDKKMLKIEISNVAEQNIFVGQIVTSDSREIQGDNESIANYYYRLEQSSKSIFYPSGYLNIATFFSGSNVDKSSKYYFGWTFVSPSGHYLTYKEFFQGVYNTRKTKFDFNSIDAKELKNINFYNIADVIPSNLEKQWFGEWKVFATFMINKKTVEKISYFTLLPETKDLVNFDSYRKPIEEKEIAGKKNQTITYSNIRGIKMPVIITEKSLNQWTEEENEKSIMKLLDKISDNNVTILVPDKKYYMVTNAGVEGIDKNNNYKVKIGAVFVEKSVGSSKNIQILDNNEYALTTGNVVSEFSFTLPQQINKELIEVSSIWKINDAIAFTSPPLLLTIKNK